MVFSLGSSFFDSSSGFSSFLDAYFLSPHFFSNSSTTISSKVSWRSLWVSVALIMLLSVMNWFRISLHEWEIANDSLVVAYCCCYYWDLNTDCEGTAQLSIRMTTDLRKLRMVSKVSESVLWSAFLDIRSFIPFESFWPCLTDSRIYSLVYMLFKSNLRSLREFTNRLSCS